MNNEKKLKEKIKVQSLENMFKERGKVACFKSALFIVAFFFIHIYFFNISVDLPSYIFAFTVLFLYETFKKKIFIKLHDMLNTAELK